MAFLTVNGDERANSELGYVTASIVQARADNDTRRMALRAALEREQVVVAEEDTGKREEALAKAVVAARRVIAAAKAVDQMAADLRRLADEVAEAEGDVWRHLREAQSDVNDGIIGRLGMARICLNVVSTCNEREAFRHRPAGEVVAVAWGSLVGEDGGK